MVGKQEEVGRPGGLSSQAMEPLSGVSTLRASIPDAERRMHVVCACRSPEHQMILSYFPGEDHPEVYVEIHLCRQSFWRRLRYLFGYQCKYGAFQEILLSPQTAREIATFLHGFASEGGSNA